VPEEEHVQVLNLIYLAKWMGVPPWELAQQPIFWADYIALAVDIENSVARTMRERDHGD
jgi:hypothetical protein